MNVFVLLLTCFLVFFSALFWMKKRKPWTPHMLYDISRKWYDIILNVGGFWLFLFASGYFEVELVKVPDMRPTFIMLFTRLISFLITWGLLIFKVTRPTHPGPFAIPAVMNMLATCSQYEALKWVAFAEFGAAKALRVMIVGLYGSKSIFERILWGIISIIAAKFIFWYEFNRVDWTLPNTWGLLWLILFVWTDSLTSVSQEEIFKKFKVDNITMMYYINGFMLLLLIPQIFVEEDLIAMLIRTFSFKHYILNLCALTICSLMAQYFVIRLIRQYGALTFVVSCLIRSMITIIIAKYLRVGYWEWFEVGEFLAMVLIIIAILNKRKPWKKKNRVPYALQMDLMPLKSYD